MKENKKIGVLIDNITHSGGTERVASILSSGLIERGNEVCIFSLIDGKPYFPMHSSVTYWKDDCNNRMLKIFRISRYINKYNFDALIIISMGKLSFQSLPILKVFSRNVKIISCDHVSIESFKNPLRTLKCWSYSLADEVCVLTEYDKRFLTEKYKVKNVNVVRNISPYENISFNEGDLKRKKKIVIGVGRLAYQKNFLRLIDIWSQSHRDDWELHIIGTGEEHLALKEHITSKKLQESVKLIGACNDMSLAYSSAAILCMTSRYEGLPMVLIECKNFGIPAIALKCKTGPEEIIENDGYVISYEDDNAFSKRLSELIADDDLRIQYSKNALNNAQTYSSRKIIDQWLVLIGR
ncbi:MAG: glycosyltransferase family 4 protein [Rouxiella badensis]|uniref:glycosyltransferase family 4 protein n=1 Tax=Rouxiella badensis TaxID=1646377 RepID=UPI003C42DDB4